jgi:hypothetical protein
MDTGAAMALRAHRHDRACSSSWARVLIVMTARAHRRETSLICRSLADHLHHHHLLSSPFVVVDVVWVFGCYVFVLSVLLVFCFYACCVESARVLIAARAHRHDWRSRVLIVMTARAHRHDRACSSS